MGVFLDVDIRTFWCKIFQIFRNLWGARTDKEVGGRTSAERCQIFVIIADKGVIWGGRLLCMAL